MISSALDWTRTKRKMLENQGFAGLFCTQFYPNGKSTSQLRLQRPEVRIPPAAPKRSLYCSTATFLFCHGLVLVNPFFDYVRGNIGHDRHEKTDKIAHGISFPCWFCTLGSTRAILSVFVFIKNPIQGFGRQSWAQKAHSGACCQQRITRRPLLEPRRKGCHSASRGA